MYYVNNKVFNFEHQQAQEIFRVCRSAYREVEEVRYLVQQTNGLDEMDLVWVGISANNVWRNVLTKASSAGKLRDLLLLMLSDSRIAHHHPDIKKLLELSSVTGDEFEKIGREEGLPKALADLLTLIERGVDTSKISIDLLRAARACKPSNIVAYRIHRIAFLMQQRFAVDNRFINLTITYNKRDYVKPKEYNDLQDVLSSLPDNSDVVLLGAPGAGKSTLLRKLERDLAENGLKSTNETQIPLPFFVSLNRFPLLQDLETNFLDNVMKWLEYEWASRFPKMPSLVEIMDEHPMILLLDGLNEMPYKNRSEQNLMMRKWRELALTMQADNHKMLFSCRNLDYTGTLGTSEFPVPQVQVQPLTPEKVNSFVQANLPSQADVVWSKIRDSSGLLATLSSPFFLNLFVEQAPEYFESPYGQAALISGFIKKALRREVENNNWPFRAGELLSQNDCDNILRINRSSTHVFPGGNNLIKELCKLAYEMQNGSLRSDGGQVRIEVDEVKNIITGDAAEIVLKAGVALGVIDEDFESMDTFDYQETVAFKHQLFQEYFAARQLVLMDEELIAELVRVPWQINEMEEPIQEVIAMLSVDEPLPLLPQTGWEETLVLASSMVARPERLLQSLLRVNLPLAGRCAAQFDINISVTQKRELAKLLIGRIENVSADLRHRISAGLVLGDLGDSRFRLEKGPFGNYILPPMVEILQGNYKIGSDAEEADKDERNGPVLYLKKFKMGRYLVTNAEWKLFMQAGGYEDERWWATTEAKSWWRGDSISVVTKERLRQGRNWLINNQSKFYGRDDLSQEVIKHCAQIIEFTDDEFEAILDKKIPASQYRKPRHWDNKMFNNPSQPVVGICLYEAQAYCEWLSAQSANLYRLPTEFEWEAAARGEERRVFAHGNDYNPLYFNVRDTHIGHTTPVGIFPNGNTPTGISDMIGNCWEWTISRYAAYDDANAVSRVVNQLLMIVRRGSYYGGGKNIRASSRYYNSPNRRNDYLGFRVISTFSIE